MDLTATIIFVCAIAIIVTICCAFVTPLIKLLLDYFAYKSRMNAFDASDPNIVVLPGKIVQFSLKSTENNVAANVIETTDQVSVESKPEQPPPSYDDVISGREY